MARVNRRPKRRSAGYTDDHVQHLLRGTFLCPGHGFSSGVRHEVDYVAMRTAWELLRADLMAQWIEQNPFTRPYAWWKFDAPERRQRIDGTVHPFDDRVRKAHVEKMAAKSPSFRDEAYKLHRGRPSCLCVSDDFEAQYESDLEYLQRLDLLTDAERELIR